MRATFLLSTLLATTALSQSLEIGKPFPLIALPYLDLSTDKSLHSLADFHGQKTVVHIFAGW